MRPQRIRVSVSMLLLFGCGAPPGGGTSPRSAGEALDPARAGRTPTTPASDESVFAPLDVGADYATYRKVSTAPFLSRTHGGRFVEVYVNEIGHAAYVGEGDFPVGSVVVKTSWENQGGQPSDVAGPTFVMRKEAGGYLPEHGDWTYAIHWENPTSAQVAALGGPIYWRGKSKKVGYCYQCHDNYDREIGGVPKDFRAW